MTASRRFPPRIDLYALGAMAGRPPSREAPMFGRRVAALRKQAGLTQAELARALGVSTPLIGYYERQTPNPTLEVVNKLAVFFDVAPGFFLDEEAKKGEGKRGPTSELDLRIERLRQLPKSKHKLLLRMLDAFIDDLEASP